MSTFTATLCDANFQVDVLTGDPGRYEVRATVNVEFGSLMTSFIDAFGPVKLESTILGQDGASGNSRDDLLYSFETQSITRSGIYTFSAIIPREYLNEDHSWMDVRDEVFSRFNLVGTTFHFRPVTANSPIITGRF